MIAQNTIDIQPKPGITTPALQLAPYTADDLRPWLPFSEDFQRYNPLPKAGFTFEDADEIHNLCQKYEHEQRWGIFVKDGLKFIGSVALSHVNLGTLEAPHYTRIFQEIHTGIYASEWRGKSIGTIAKLAVVSHAQEHMGTYGFMALTAEHNLPAQASLYKAGFRQTGATQHYEFKEDQLTQDWMLVHPDGHRAYPKEAAMFAEGWERFEAALGQLTIRTT